MTVDGGGVFDFLLQASVVAEKLFRISSGIPRNFIPTGGGSTNSVEDRGHRERGSGGR